MRHAAAVPRAPDSGRLLRAAVREDGVWTLWERDPGPPEQLGAFPRVVARETSAFLCTPGLSRVAEFPGRVLWTDPRLEAVLTYGGASLTLFRPRREAGARGGAGGGGSDAASQESASVLRSCSYSSVSFQLPEFAVPAAAAVGGGLVACVYAEKAPGPEEQKLVHVDAAAGLSDRVAAMMFAWVRVFPLRPGGDTMGWPEGAFPVAIPIRDWVDSALFDGTELVVRFRGGSGRRLLYRMPPGRYEIAVAAGGAVLRFNGERDLKPRHDRLPPEQYYAGAPEAMRVSGDGVVAYVLPYQERSVVVQVRGGAISLVADLLGRAVACEGGRLYVCRASPRELLSIRTADLLLDHGVAAPGEATGGLQEAFSGLPFAPAGEEGVDYVARLDDPEPVALAVQELQSTFPKPESAEPSLEYARQLDEIATMLGDSGRELDALSQLLSAAGSA